MRDAPVVVVAAMVAALVLSGNADPAAVSPADAEVVLQQATAFRDVAVGYAGATPPEVRAFRKIVAAPDGAVRFRRLAARATVAGRLYALCGLFFLDAPAFDAELARLQGRDAKVERQEGCIVFESPLSDVLAPASGAPRMSHAVSFREWLRVGLRARAHDIVGGSTCYRLRFGSTFPAEWVEDPSRAPENGPPPDEGAR